MATVITPDVQVTCDLLTQLNRRRNLILKREHLINRPGEQAFKMVLLEQIDEDHGLSTKQLYDRAAKLRKRALESFDVLDLHASVEDCEEEVLEKIVVSGDFNESEEQIVSDLIGDLIADKFGLNFIRSKHKRLKKSMQTAAKDLPAYEWWSLIRGCNGFGLAKIIGETGNLSKYANPGKVWKRLGLAPVKGKAASQLAKGDLTNDEWSELGYCPRRRSAMYTIGDAVLKQKPSEYYDIFFERKLRECEKVKEEGRIVTTGEKTTAANWAKAGLPEPEVVKDFDAKKHRACGHVHARAQRYMEKRLIRELWKEWRRLS